MSVDTHDHFRADADTPVPAGVYRVVGTGETVTLLRVADEAGRRENSGTVEHVDWETLAEAFERAENPDAGFSLSSLLAPFTTLPKAVRHWLGI